MEAPEKIWINPSIDLPKLNGVLDKDSVQYVRKDVVDNMLATAEVHAYFTGGESEREKLALKKDALIEKACVKLKKLMYDNLMFQGRLHREEVIDNFVETFKNYLKGE